MLACHVCHVQPHTLFLLALAEEQFLVVSISLGSAQCDALNLYLFAGVVLDAPTPTTLRPVTRYYIPHTE